MRKQPTRQGANTLLALIEHERANVPATDVDYLNAPCLLLERSRDGRMQVNTVVYLYAFTCFSEGGKSQRFSASHLRANLALA